MYLPWLSTMLDCMEKASIHVPQLNVSRYGVVSSRYQHPPKPHFTCSIIISGLALLRKGPSSIHYSVVAIRLPT